MPNPNRIYLIAPMPVSADSQAADNTFVGGQNRYVLVASSGIASIAAWFPQDADIRLCEEIVEPVDFDDPAEIIGISINVSQMARGLEIAREFRRRGRQVVLGGPHVSLAPELFEGEGDCLVIGEIEPIAQQFVADALSGTLAPVYQGGKADMNQMPSPRWDLYPNHLACSASVQTSRGCPFECNFCDVIQYVGRKQRHKSAENVISECQQLYDLGYRDIFLSDDNFTVYRRRSQELLQNLATWNNGPDHERVSFSTQVSVDLARDPELLQACNDAGLRHVFVGLESSDEEALEASKKRQNLKVDLRQECETITEAGLTIRAGLIVGFDTDDSSCFERQYRFAQSLPVVRHQVSVLVAPLATPLFAELEKAGRIVESRDYVTNVGMTKLTNFLPARMSRTELAEGYIWLRQALLDPDATIQRFETYARTLGAGSQNNTAMESGRRQASPMLDLIKFMVRDPGARRVIMAVREMAAERPEIEADIVSQLALYLNDYRQLGDSSAFSSVSVKYGAI